MLPPTCQPVAWWPWDLVQVIFGPKQVVLKQVEVEAQLLACTQRHLQQQFNSKGIVGTIPAGILRVQGMQIRQGCCVRWCWLRCCHTMAAVATATLT